MTNAFLKITETYWPTETKATNRPKSTEPAIVAMFLYVSFGSDVGATLSDFQDSTSMGGWAIGFQYVSVLQPIKKTYSEGLAVEPCVLTFDQRTSMNSFSCEHLWTLDFLPPGPRQQFLPSGSQDLSQRFLTLGKRWTGGWGKVPRRNRIKDFNHGSIFRWATELAN